MHVTIYGVCVCNEMKVDVMLVDICGTGRFVKQTRPHKCDRNNERREEWLTIIVYVLALKERKKKEEIG